MLIVLMNKVEYYIMRDSTTLHNPLLGSELIPLNSSKPEERLTKNIKILPSFNKNEINLKSPPSPFPRSINASTASIPNDIIIGNKQQQQQQRFPVILNQSGQNGKMRKTISPPRFQLLPHLGPQAETDIMNSSFASSCRTTLGPPSVSADV
uniref:Uncharacterized protein n=1 Tax=Meloidogyne hapla TaxID=6305 RepID=A0A1I8BZD3_MELHA